MSDLIELGGLWAKKDKNGRSYLTGKLSRSVRILIFKNDFRTNENQPSHVMYLAPVEQLDGTGRPPETDEFLEDELEAAPPASRAPSVREPASDEYSEPPLRPAPQPNRRPAPASAPPPTPQARPAATNAAPANRPRTATNTSRPAARPTPPPADDFADMEDPFADE